MAISSLVNRNEYTGTDSTAVYNYSFKIFQQSDLDVRLVLISTGVETALTLTTDYTVSGVGSITGGSITLVAGNLSSLYKLIIRRKLALTQGTSIKNQGDYYPELHENQFDKSLMIDQQQQEELNRSVKFAQAGTGVNPEIPASYTDADSAILVMKTDGSGFRETPVTLDSLAAAVAAADGTITPNRVYVSDANGMPVASSATDVEAGYLSGATSNIQTQINGKEPSFSVLPISKGGTNSNTTLTNSKVIVSTGGALVESSTTTTQLSYLDATSSIQTQLDSKIGLLGVVTRTSAYTATISDGLINCSSAAFTINLYTAVGNAGRELTIVKTDASLSNIITIDANASETIDGALTFKLTTLNNRIVIVSDGANWIIKSHTYSTALTSAGTITIGATTTGPTKGTTTTDDLSWYRDGRHAVLTYKIVQTNATGANNGSGDYLPSLPSGMNIDTTVSPAYTASVGTPLHQINAASNSKLETDLHMSTSGAYNFNSATAYVYSTTQFRLSMFYWSGSISSFSWGSTSFAFSNNPTLGIHLTVRVPISGWGP